MIDRLTDRDAFRRLRAEGRRIRGGPLSLVVRPDPGRSSAAVGFAIPRRVGNAVTRNRLRRRLRELHRELDREGLLAPGEYLVVVEPSAAECEYAALRREVRDLHSRAVSAR